MLPNLYFNSENKTLFAYFLTISFLIHLIIVFSSSSISRFIKSDFNHNKYASKESNYVIEIALEPEKEEEIIEEEEIPKEEEEKVEALKEEEKAKGETPEKKRQLFVDTSDNDTDEDPQVDTNKIGEKSSIAKDMYEGEDNINTEPKLAGKSELRTKEPDELVSVKPLDSSIPIEVGGEISPLATERKIDILPSTNNSEIIPTEDEIEDANTQIENIDTIMHTPEPIKEKPVDDDLPSTDNGEILVLDNEVEKPDELSEELTAQETKSDDAKDTSPQASDIDITQPALEPEEAVSETESFESIENKTKTSEETESIAESDKKYTKVASIPKNKIKEIIEESKEDVLNEIQNNIVQPESQISNTPTGNNAPFFEDNISNAPIKGKESFNIKKHEYAPYYKQIRDKITWYWLLQYGTDASINLETSDYSPVKVEFMVLPSGKITNVVITNAAGNELLASKIQRSIQNTTLDKFPEYVN